MYYGENKTSTPVYIRYLHGAFIEVFSDSLCKWS